MTLAAIANFQAAEFLNSIVSLLAAFVLGTLIGAERQYRQRTAGLRTNALVALGAAAFVDLGTSLQGKEGAVHVLAYVASGVGFLGAGVILKEGMNIRGLNTAATLWCSAAVGATAGADHVAEAVLLCALTIASNTFLRPLVRLVERAPIEQGSTEATWQVIAICTPDSQDAVRDAIVETLEAAAFAIREIEAQERPNGMVEWTATLAATSVVEDELAPVAKAIERVRGVAHATWTSTADD